MWRFNNLSSTTYLEDRLDYTERAGPRYAEEKAVSFRVFAKYVLDHAGMEVEDPDTGVTTHYKGNRVIGLEVGIGISRRYIVVINDQVVTREPIIPDLPRFHESN